MDDKILLIIKDSNHMQVDEEYPSDPKEIIELFRLRMTKHIGNGTETIFKISADGKTVTIEYIW